MCVRVVVVYKNAGGKRARLKEALRGVCVLRGRDLVSEIKT